jgi:ABC-type amino acid transport substrate-binding protein
MKSKCMNVFCLVIMAVIFFFGNACAQETSSATPVFTVYTIYIPGLLTNDLTGPFVDLNQEIGRRANVQLVLEIVPPKRQRALFKKKEYDIIFPMHAAGLDDETPYERSSAFYVKKDFVFTRKETPRVTTLSDLERMQGIIGLTHGYSYPEELLSNPKLTFVFAPSDDNNMQMLAAGRTAAFIVEEVSGLQAIKNSNLGHVIRYDPATPLYEVDVFYAFQPETRLNAVRKAISCAIDEIKADGSLEKFLEVLQSPDRQNSTH